jgi:hypothetical protein
MNSVQGLSQQQAAEQWRNDFFSSRRLESPREARFRYGYLCRLIDDAELDRLPEPLRSRTRDIHKASYWKTLSLLRRDAEFVLRVRREKMAAEKQWDFALLVSDYSRIQLLLMKLTLAGLSHSVRLGAGLESAREACREFETFLSPASLAQPAFSAAGA